ncbi:MAG: carboxypeptidase regulatory-like domain-containing protein, partial [Polyangiales bacterium]
APQGQLRIRHATHVPWQGTVPACHRIVQLQLAAGVTLRASLRDAATDRPIAGATATLTRPGPGPAPPAVHSDADGSVRFAPVGAGAYTLHVQHPHYPGWQQPLHLTTRDLEHQARTLAPVELPPGASVRGQVVDRFGVAAAGMHVRAIALNEKTGVRSSATRDDGRFGLHGLPAGPVRLEVYDDAGTLWHQHTLSLEAGDTLTDLRLRLVDLRLP